ncbi:unnamed protein product, partial [Amoebophrya sp. A120]
LQVHHRATSPTWSRVMMISREEEEDHLLEGDLAIQETTDPFVVHLRSPACKLPRTFSAEQTVPRTANVVNTEDVHKNELVSTPMNWVNTNAYSTMLQMLASFTASSDEIQITGAAHFHSTVAGAGLAEVPGRVAQAAQRASGVETRRGTSRAATNELEEQDADNDKQREAQHLRSRVLELFQHPVTHDDFRETRKRTAGTPREDHVSCEEESLVRGQQQHQTQ